MPYKFELLKDFKIALKYGMDKRVKLKDSDRKNILRLYVAGVSIHGLARFFHVSRRLIQFIVHPDVYARSKVIRKENMVYNSKKHAEYQKVYRKHKQELYLKYKEEKLNAKVD